MLRAVRSPLALRLRLAIRPLHWEHGSRKALVCPADSALNRPLDTPESAQLLDAGPLTVSFPKLSLVLFHPPNMVVPMRRCDNGSADTFCTTSGSSPPILDVGLDYIELRGWPVLPVYPRRKNPFLATGYKELPPLTPDELRRYFAETPDLNIGMHTGGNLIVIDVDEKPGKMSGSKALAALEAIYGPVPPTLTSITGGGGRQLFFYLPPGYGPFGDRLPVVAEWLRSHPEADSAGVIDIRNDGLVVLPPSIHENGNRYAWLDPDAEIATLPLAWCQTPLEARRPTTSARAGPHPGATPAYPERRISSPKGYRRPTVESEALLGKDRLPRQRGRGGQEQPALALYVADHPVYAETKPFLQGLSSRPQAPLTVHSQKDYGSMVAGNGSTTG